MPLTVTEAPQGSTWGPEVLQLPGLELLRASLERRLPDPPVTKLTGLRLSEVGLGLASAWMPASAWWQSAAGVFLAGTTAFAADMALGSSVLTSVPAGRAAAAPGRPGATPAPGAAALRAPTSNPAVPRSP